MMNQAGADRPKQAAVPPGSTVTSDDHHLGFFGQIDKGRYSSAEKELAVHLRPIAVNVLDGLDRVGDHPAALVLLNLEDFLRDPAGRPRERRDQNRQGDGCMNDGERDVAHYGFAGGPPHRHQ